MNLWAFQPAIDARLRRIERDGLEHDPWVTVSVPVAVALTLGEILIEELEEHGASLGLREDWAKHGNRLRVIDRFMAQVKRARAKGEASVEVAGSSEYVWIIICWLAISGVSDVVEDSLSKAMEHGGELLQAAGTAVREYRAVIPPDCT